MKKQSKTRDQESWEERFDKKFVLSEDLDDMPGKTYYLDEDITPQDIYDFIRQELALARKAWEEEK